MQKNIYKTKVLEFTPNRIEKMLQNTEEFLFVLNDITIPVLVSNPDESILYVNSALEKATGFSSDELIGRTAPYPWWPEESIPKIHQDFQTLKQRGILEIEELFTKKNGKLFWVTLISTAIIINGDLKYYLVTWVDISERKKHEETLKEKEKMYRSVYELSSDAMHIWTPDLRSLHGNPALLKLWGCSTLKELISHSLLDFCAESQPDGTPSAIKMQQVATTVLEKGSCLFDWKFKRLDGTQFYFSVSTSRIKLKDKIIFQSTIRDITEKTLLEQALLQKQKELEAKTKNLEETNIALNVLLEKREADKKEVEEKVQISIKELIEPCLDKLKKDKISESQKMNMDMLETHLKNIISPFSHTLSMKFLRLTHAEVNIASHIKQGMTTNEIASLLNLSIQTIESHRKNIRKKLGINKKKENLETYLNTLQ